MRVAHSRFWDVADAHYSGDEPRGEVFLTALPITMNSGKLPHSWTCILMPSTSCNHGPAVQGRD